MEGSLFASPCKEMVSKFVVQIRDLVCTQAKIELVPITLGKYIINIYKTVKRSRIYTWKERSW